MALLNSKLADYYIRNLGVTRNGGYFEYKPMFIEQLPVPMLSDALKSDFIELADRVIEATKKREDTTKIEDEIDALVYRLYKINPEEIDFIERQAMIESASQ